jgi:hypothetical protein
MFAPLREAPEGYSEELSLGLSRFLDSEKVNDRTEDDKTLILASRYSSSILTDK